MRKIENYKCWARESSACHGSAEPAGCLIVLSGGRGCSLGLYEMLVALPAQMQPRMNSQKDPTFLWDIHEKLHYYEKQNPMPILQGAAALANDLALLSVHDTVAQKNYDPVLPPMPDDIGNEEGSVKIIYRSGIIQVGDEFREANGIPSQGAITFKIIHSIKEEAPSKEGKMFIKAEAGLSFKKGDILQIMRDANPRAGLNPSKPFQERRLALRRAEILVQPLKVSSRKSSGLRTFHLSRKDKKTNKSMCECKKSDQYDTANVPTYEETWLVLVGPVGVGLNEVKRKLLISNTQQYSLTVPYTTRPRRSQESDGIEYIFISKHLFERNKFIEYGEYKNNYYTSIDSVWSVLAKNKHLRMLEYKPYVIFIRPLSIGRLRETRKNAKIISSRDDQGAAKPFMEDDFQEMIKSAQIMETTELIVNDDLAVAFNDLKRTFDKLETDTHWIPVNWLHS
ncbi:hypothetical protein FD755_024413 [Muntiacus reevesi]|uniref:Guanylate kinase-like domain-containing protein n=1 Tax=Muntiacus reevesi TaxID=9886 RepID=A0A5N3V9X0_MUNRE|nr:hypothetical protein FD755_024413 [Muntiacus reevesi]